MTTNRSFWSRPRGPLLLGAAACAACCATPMVAVAIGAGAASTVAAVVEPIAGLLLVTAAVLAIALLVRWRRARAAAAACVTDASCGCGPGTTKTLYSSPEPAAGAPIACTADLANKAAVQLGIDEYRRAFGYLVGSERTRDGFRWRFRNAAGLEPRLQRLARAEHACCSFMKFDVAFDGDAIVWQVRADTSTEAQRAVEEYMRMPERLREEPRRGLDVAHLEACATRAGIAFMSADAG